MRPLGLVIEGFGAFRDRVVVDFTDTDFFALVGPTGAGKTTVIDAICFALYGKVPRYDDDRLVSQAVALGAGESRVSLRFESGGVTYHAVRVVRRKADGSAVTREARLEREEGDGTSNVLAGKARELTDAVESVLGLSFEHFTRCVVLPQGRFAEFLHDKPAQRQELLVELLDLGLYGRVGEHARHLARDLSADVRHAEHDLADLAAASPEVLAQREHEAGSLTDLRTQVERAGEQLQGLREQLAQGDHEAAELRNRLKLLGATQMPASVAPLAERRAHVRSRLDAAAAELARSAAKVAKLEARAASLGPLDAARERSNLFALAEQLITDAGATLAAAAVARKAHDAALQASERAHGAVDAARTAREQVREREFAHVLRAALVPGEPCPVCTQPVASFFAAASSQRSGSGRSRARAASPHRDGALDLEQAEALLDKAVRAASVADRALADAQRALAGAERDAERAAKDRDALSAQLAALGMDAAGADKLLRQVEQAHSAANDARAADLAARGRHVQTTDSLAQLDRSLTNAWTEFHAARDALAVLGPPAPVDDLLEAWASLAAWADRVRPQVQGELDALETRTRRLAGDAERVTGEAFVKAAGCGVHSRDHTLSALRRDVDTALFAAREAAALLRAQLKRAAELRSLLQARRVDADVAKDLGNLLSAAQFEKWLLDAALRELARGASAVLEELSSGQFSLDVDGKGEFEVIDHRNADERRSARTLSGGETFQASLALALALADQLSGLAVRGPVKLDAIFLDEGFGTLDAEALDVVASTIENLGGGERMVGIVTHVRELAERVPVRFVVTKHDRTSTVVKEVA